MGRKHEPTFRLVLTDSKNSSKSGKFDEVLGSYDPRKTTEAFKADRIKDLVAKGIGLTGSVNNLLIRKGIIRGKKTHVGTDFVAKVAPAEEATQASSEPSDQGAETPAEEANVEVKPEEASPAAEETPQA